MFRLSEASCGVRCRRSTPLRSFTQMHSCGHSGSTKSVDYPAAGIRSVSIETARFRSLGEQKLQEELKACRRDLVIRCIGP